MTSSTARGVFFLLGALFAGISPAGDRLGVSEVLHTIPISWGEASFSIDVSGLSRDGEGIVDQQLGIEHEAALAGYISYLRISSHGDISLFRSQQTSSTVGTDSYLIKAPLGMEQVIVLFSNSPLEGIFPSGSSSRELGSDRASAQAFMQQLLQIESQGVKVASRRFEFMVSTAAGGTQYTTRSIIKRVEEASRLHSGGSAAKIPSRVEFEFDSDRLTESGKRDLDEFGEAMVSKLAGRDVMLEGHTDAVGTDEYNQVLSERRARAVKQYLTASFGIPESRLGAVGMGKSDPIAPNDNDADRSLNRRVDFIFTGRPDAPNRQ